MPDLLWGARDFLRDVFAHRDRARIQQIESFRRVTLDDLPGRASKEGARASFDRPGFLSASVKTYAE